MIPMSVEGVRRNFSISSVFLYSVFLIDETGQRLLVLSVERQEALPIVAVLNNLTLPRPQTINVMVETLKLFGCTLEEIHIENLSVLPPIYNQQDAATRCSRQRVQSSLLDKAAPFLEEDMEQRKKEYLAFLLAEDA